MKTSDFYYDLPEDLIAQHPLEDRAQSRLMTVNRKTGEISEGHFYEIIDNLNAGDVLVLNDTRVMPARLFGHRKEKEESIEFLLLKKDSKGIWECLTKPGKKAKIGTTVIFSEKLSGEVIGISEEGSRFVRFDYEGIFEEILDELGEMPLPPYIHEKLKDQERYQTVYSRYEGSAAAPTAGLHFTQKLLQDIKNKGVHICYITLHVGLGTFRPVKVDDIDQHHMHSEYYSISKEVAETINQAIDENRRIVSVGTTTTRTLETVANEKGYVKEGSGWTNIFIYPGYRFKCVQALITNFHLPESTLLMLVSAFSTRQIIMDAYHQAVEEKFRFFSFGDSMFLY
ncbi:MAG: tRNA preQ1(34) S-adenosylmethionine ribosyltransferase-isomerase QueA [Tissierellia bacterium]|nr:tRNA preQ1(34) S-adenosylmethionine ribosyltransferase-isomerase QueA [Tissierellia bacterium]